MKYSKSLFAMVLVLCYQSSVAQLVQGTAVSPQYNSNTIANPIIVHGQIYVGQSNGSTTTAVGRNALNNGTTGGTSNTAFGNSVLSAVTGAANTGMGDRAMEFCLGSNNVVIS